MSNFHDSPAQIIRRVFNSVTDRIKVDISSDLQKKNKAIEFSILNGILKELKIMNIHLSKISDLDIEE